METKLLSLPENDSEVRYVLGKKGKRNLLAICLNPSTANAFKHDGTTNNVEKIAKANGYDGWVLFNVSPQRTPHPSDLPLVENEAVLIKNVNLLDDFILKNEFQISDVLLAWGNTITSFQHPYLIKYAAFILERLKKHELNYWCIKLTAKQHPFHPAAQAINRYVGPVEDIVLQPFNTVSYLKRIAYK